jgi:excinuclease UvrABC nuclease subunit
MVPPIEISAAEFDAQLPEVPNQEGVFVIWAGERPAYLAKTGMLRRRMLRVLRPGAAGRSLNLRGIATRVEYWLTGSRFESGFIHYELAKRQHPETYLEAIKLRMPPYVRLVLSNPFPRTQVATRLSSGKAAQFGPFRTRAAAEMFETQMLDLFQIRRCQEDLSPSAEHPGCIYGEMNMCLRPCQEVVNASEYLGEVRRVEEFLGQNGKGLLQSITAARDRFSEEMNFEEAARQHQRLERVNRLLALREDLACEVERLYGVAVTKSATTNAVKLWFVCRGCWQAPVDFALLSSVSLDLRLKELVAGLRPVTVGRQERQEHLAILARWNYSSWRDGEWIGFEGLDKVPYRRLVNAISRVSK